MPSTPSNDNRLFQKRMRVLPLIIRDELTDRQRQVIVAYYVEKRSTREIAARLGLSVSTVQHHRKQAEARIARYLRYCG